MRHEKFARFAKRGAVNVCKCEAEPDALASASEIADRRGGESLRGSCKVKLMPEKTYVLERGIIAMDLKPARRGLISPVKRGHASTLGNPSATNFFFFKSATRQANLAPLFVDREKSDAAAPISLPDARRGLPCRFRDNMGTRGFRGSFGAALALSGRCQQLPI